MTSEETRQDLLRLMGAGRGSGDGARVTHQSEEARDGFVLERLLIQPGTSGAEPVPALFTRPEGEGPWPAVLYCHAHGGTYPLGKSELLEGRDIMQKPAYGPALAERGIAALCLDMPCFEERQQPGELTRAKALMWHGRTLFGLMIDDLLCGLDYLQGRADVVSDRIATVGLSMGCTHAWWLAALDERVCCVASMCCLADIGEMVADGSHDRHGIYLMIPGLAERYETGRIAGLIAPRPHLSTIGGRDALTPSAAGEKAAAAVEKAYEAAGVPENWTLLVEPEAGHEETPRMRSEIMAFLQRHLANR